MIYDGTCPYCGGRLELVSPGINDERVCDTCDYMITASGEEIISEEGEEE